LYSVAATHKERHRGTVSPFGIVSYTHSVVADITSVFPELRASSSFPRRPACHGFHHSRGEPWRWRRTNAFNIVHVLGLTHDTNECSIRAIRSFATFSAIAPATIVGATVHILGTSAAEIVPRIDSNCIGIKITQQLRDEAGHSPFFWSFVFHATNHLRESLHEGCARSNAVQASNNRICTR
jgi:hypothetical protein